MGTIVVIPMVSRNIREPLSLLAAAWQRLRCHTLWTEVAQAHARMKVLHRASELEALQPSFAADLRAAAESAKP